MPQKIECPSCGAELSFGESRKKAFCEYCGNEIALNNIFPDMDHSFTYVDEAKVKEIEFKTQKFNAEQEELRELKEDRKNWAKIRNAWLIAVLVLFALNEVTQISAIASLGSIILLFGGIYVYITYPKGSSTDSSTTTTINKGFTNVFVTNTPAPLPWYCQTGWIIVLGFFTGCLYWFIGPFIRIYWKNKHGYR